MFVCRPHITHHINGQKDHNGDNDDNDDTKEETADPDNEDIG